MAPRQPRDFELSMMRCRTYGHAWDEFTPIDLPPKAGWQLSLRCIRCTTERHDVIDLVGNLSERRYVYPDGYRDATADHRLSRQEYRQALYERIRTRSRRQVTQGAA